MHGRIFIIKRKDEGEDDIVYPDWEDLPRWMDYANSEDEEQFKESLEWIRKDGEFSQCIAEDGTIEIKGEDKMGAYGDYYNEIWEAIENFEEKIKRSVGVDSLLHEMDWLKYKIGAVGNYNFMFYNMQMGLLSEFEYITWGYEDGDRIVGSMDYHM